MLGLARQVAGDMVAIAVSIKDRKNRFYSSLAIQAPATRVSPDGADRYVTLLREAANDQALLTEE